MEKPEQWLIGCADSANPILYGNHLEKENLLNQSNHIETNSYQGTNHKVGPTMMVLTFLKGTVAEDFGTLDIYDSGFPNPESEKMMLR